MADQAAADDLKYGHFGQAVYSHDDQIWLFPRSLESSLNLYPLGPPQLISKSQYSQSRPSTLTTDKSSSVHLNRQIAQLCAADPTIVAAADLLVEPAVVSKEVLNTVARYDPTVGQLLAFGRVPDTGIKRSMPIVAFPAADHPRILRLIQVQTQKHGWEHNKSIWINVPRIHGESAVWEAPHPIRQICFAPVDEDSDLVRFLAVRTTLAVYILRISVRKHSASWDSITETPSRFRTEQLCCVDMRLTQGETMAHVAFNHWYSGQFITVDQRGTWRVWDISLPQNSSEVSKPVELCRGAVNDHAVPEDEATDDLSDDGWARATWAGNVQTIVTATRRSLGIYDIQMRKPVRLQSPGLGIAGTPHWILDILLNPLDPTTVFVLTSVSLFCLRVRCLDEFKSETYFTAGAEVALQCRHYRDSEDIGLSLSSHVDNEGICNLLFIIKVQVLTDTDVVIMIKSSLDPLATSYRFQSDEFAPSYLKVMDVTPVILPTFSSTITSSAALSFDTQAATYGDRGDLVTSGPGEIYRDLSIQFFVATVITIDMVVAQQVYYALPHSIVESSIPNVAPLDWRGRLIHSRPRLQGTEFVEQFAEYRELSKIDEELAIASFSRSKMSKSGQDDWTMVYELSHARTTSGATQKEDFAHIVDRIKQARRNVKTAASGHKLLSELCDKPIQISDIDYSAAEFNDLVTQSMDPSSDVDDGETSLLLSRIASNAALNIGLGDATDLVAVYDNIIARWLIPLSHDVPGRVRLVKEQLVRRVAAQVCLASYVLRHEPVKPAEEETQTLESQASGGASFSHPYFSQSSLPTPSPTATPSLTTATSLSSHPSTLEIPEYERLQRYTTFASRKSTPGTLPKALTNTLAHWTIGGNPDDYDWLATQREQERRAEEDDEDLTPKERARLKRRAERLLFKQRREALKASAMAIASSQAPGIISASQPTFATSSRSEAPNDTQNARGVASQGITMLASSQAQPSIFASQVQPGRFGGKPAKKKRRVVGF
jgi:RNA polymerase I-specific transcription initiation factor RRN6